MPRITSSGQRLRAHVDGLTGIGLEGHVINVAPSHRDRKILVGRQGVGGRELASPVQGDEAEIIVRRIDRLVDHRIDRAAHQIQAAVVRAEIDGAGDVVQRQIEITLGCIKQGALSVGCRVFRVELNRLGEIVQRCFRVTKL